MHPTLGRCRLALIGLFIFTRLPFIDADPGVRKYPQCRQTKVVVLGGGITGITAAQALTNASISDFVIVEYLGDLGGRVAHTSFGSQLSGSQYTVELGANWIQGLTLQNGAENPIWFLAQKYKLNTTRSNYRSIKTYTEVGYNNFSSLFHDFAVAQAAFINHPQKILSENLKDISVRSALSYVGWRSRLQPQKQAVEWYGFDYEYASTPEESTAAFDISGYSKPRDGFAGGDHFVHDARGFSTIIKGEASTFLNCSLDFDCSQDARLLLNTIVTKISYSNTSVTISNADGSCIVAEYAICTFSLGVLQHNVVSFDPPLPEAKRVGIAAITMATFTKIFLQFPRDKVFWDTSTQFFLYADPVQRGYYPLFQSLDGPGFLPGSGIMFVTVVQDQSYMVEAQDDETTKMQVLDVLRNMFGAENVPNPIAFLYPRWSLQPWAFGSYSNWGAGTRLKQQEYIRSQLGRLEFAGEATSAENFGLLQGAYLEGKRAGGKIARHLARHTR